MKRAGSYPLELVFLTTFYYTWLLVKLPLKLLFLNIFLGFIFDQTRQLGSPWLLSLILPLCAYEIGTKKRAALV